MQLAFVLALLTGYFGGLWFAAPLFGPHAAPFMLPAFAVLLLVAAAMSLWHPGEVQRASRRPNAVRLRARRPWQASIAGLGRGTAFLREVAPRRGGEDRADRKPPFPAGEIAATGHRRSPPPVLRETASAERRAPAREAPTLTQVVRLPQRLPCMYWLEPPSKALADGLLALERAYELLEAPESDGGLLLPMPAEVLALRRAGDRLRQLRREAPAAGGELVLILRCGEEPVDVRRFANLTRWRQPGTLAFGIELGADTDVQPETLSALGIEWLAVPARRLAAGSELRPVDPALEELFRGFAERGGSVVAVGVDSERLLLDVLDYPVDHATGPLFAVSGIRQRQGAAAKLQARSA